MQCSRRRSSGAVRSSRSRLVLQQRLRFASICLSELFLVQTHGCVLMFLTKSTGIYRPVALKGRKPSLRYAGISQMVVSHSYLILCVLHDDLFDMSYCWWKVTYCCLSENTACQASHWIQWKQRQQWNRLAPPCRESVKGEPKWNGQLSLLTCCEWQLEDGFGQCLNLSSCG